MHANLLEDLQFLQKTLIERGEYLSVAESCTGGLISACLSSQPGASQFFKGGLVAYRKELKASLLSLPEEQLSLENIVSEKTAELMAQGIKKLTGSDWSLSVSGFAGPKSNNPKEEVGKVAFALCNQIAYKTHVQYFKETKRDQIRQRAKDFAIKFLVSEIKQQRR